jgi:hypothetical protein
MSLPSSSSGPFVITLVAALCLSACGGGGDDSGTSPPATGTAAAPAVVAAGAPKDLGFTDSAPVPNEAAIPPFVDNVASNQRGDARYATKETNAGVRVVAVFLEFWTPSTLLVDAGQTAAAQAGFPAVVAPTGAAIPAIPPTGRSSTRPCWATTSSTWST